jgi:hypothetical protein
MAASAWLRSVTPIVLALTASSCDGSDAGAPGSGGAGSNQGGSSGGTDTTAGVSGTGGGGRPQTAGASGSMSSHQGGGGSSGVSGTTSVAGTTAGSSGANVGGGAGGGGGGGGALEPFSFFVTSLEAMHRLSGSSDGFGGDLRYGQADGLAGADKICSDIAESSMPGSGAKQWRAFLSTTKVDAATRIGNGPWYDRTGRVVAMTLEDLLQDRPNGADAAIKNDLPNEAGTPNHRPDPSLPAADNHHILTGSNAQGKLYSQTATCLDWTSKLKDNQATGRPRIGFSWPASGRTNWISGQDEGGCGAGVAIEEMGGSDPNNPIVGSGGGYGGIYCFALAP